MRKRRPKANEMLRKSSETICKSMISYWQKELKKSENNPKASPGRWEDCCQALVNFEIKFSELKFHDYKLQEFGRVKTAKVGCEICLCCVCDHFHNCPVVKNRVQMPCNIKCNPYQNKFRPVKQCAWFSRKNPDEYKDGINSDIERDND